MVRVRPVTNHARGRLSHIGRAVRVPGPFIGSRGRVRAGRLDETARITVWKETRPSRRRHGGKGFPPTSSTVRMSYA